MAVSADGKIAATGYKPVTISGEAATSRVHLLRAQSDAILIGIGTATSDNPLLTCRLPGMDSRSPVRVVLDRMLRLSNDSRLVHSARKTPLWVIGSEVSEAHDAMKLGAAGAQVIRLPTDRQPGLDLRTVLTTLSERGITRLMVEGGAKVASSFVKAGLGDEFWLIRGSQIIGEGGVPALDDLSLDTITASPHWQARESEQLGPNTLTIYGRA
jgi:diaminohydroxyphosphoribosylaminopyrimidine deaminase/5-amino-6-(5-phosphoribosylamino)uracil reductase